MKLELLGSLKPINSIIQIVLYDETLIIVGFGNEIRLYNNLLVNICPCLIYHEVHHVYGISTEYGNNSNFVAYGIGGVLWAKIISKTSQNGQKDTRMVAIHRLLLKDRILACFYIRDQKWLIGCASGNLQLCDISNGCEIITEFFLEECPILYCMKIIPKKNHSDSVMIIGGSAFSTILIWDIDFTYKKQHTQINLSQCLTGHRGVIYCVTASPCTNKIISCSDDREIRIWYRQELIDNKKSNFRNIAILLGHNARIWTVECSWENEYIVSTSEDGDLCIWVIKQMKLDSLCKIKPLEQWYKVHQGRGGRCIAIRDIKCSDKKSCGFITGSEGGDLKIWSLNLNQINLTKIPKKENNYGYYTIKPYNSDKYWFQGIHFINTRALIAVTRQGEIYYGFKKYNDVSNWNTLPIAHVPKYIYSLYGSGTNICMGSPKGGIFFFKFDDITCTITSILYFEHIGWIQNVVYSHIIAVLKDSSYIIIASDSEGNIGLSYIYKNIEYQSKILDTSMLSKYGEIKCVDSVYNSNTIILALGTVLGHFYLLRIKLEDMSVNLLNIQYQCHKGNISSIKWLNNNSLRTTGQDGKIIEYIVDITSNQPNISIKWIHKWKSPCECIIDCFQSESYGCFVIGALKHSLMLFSSDEPTSSSFQLILKQNFGGIKRSFYTKFLLQDTSLWFIMVWCCKPSINMLIIDLKKLKYIDSSILSISLQLNSNPISRELYSSCWISSDILALGGEDHYLRIYKVNQNSSYSDDNFKICKSIRMLHPLRDIKVFKISDNIYLLIVVGIKQMLNIYKVTYSNYDYILKTNKSSEINIVQLFSNLDHTICDNDHTKSHCRYICLDILYYWDKEHIIISCYIFVGSSKGEIIIFKFKYNFKENYFTNLELENDPLKLDFVPLSIRCIWTTKNPIVLVGLTNGSLKVFEVSFQDSSINLHDIKDLSFHSSGVNGISIIRYSEDVGVIFASVGHDQCLNIASTNGKIFEILHNDHLSSIRDCCYDQDNRLIYTIGWDQKLLIYRIDKNDCIIKVMDLSISIWDIASIRLSPDFKLLCITGGAGSTEIYKISTS